MNAFLAVGAALAGGAAGFPDMQSLGLVVLLLVAGLLFLGAELFIIPGFGLVGVVGIVLLIGGGVAAWTVLGALGGSLAILVTVVLAVGLAVKAFRSKALRRRLVLDTQLAQGGGTESRDLANLVGAVGTAKSDLRPAGIALVGDQRIDVVSEGGFLERGTNIKVVAVDGPRVVVAKTNE